MSETELRSWASVRIDLMNMASGSPLSKDACRHAIETGDALTTAADAMADVIEAITRSLDASAFPASFIAGVDELDPNEPITISPAKAKELFGPLYESLTAYRALRGKE